MENGKLTLPGPMLLFGSGETLPASGKAYEYLAKTLNSHPTISILETPAGFQLNSQRVAEEIAEFLAKRLQNYKPAIKVIAARRKGGKFSTDDASILEPLLTANWMFMGPGSPTYAVKNLQDSLTYDYFRALHQRGSIISLASAAVLAISKFTIPVYEIYKVGEDPFWAEGLDLLGDFGLNITFVPHWNNHDGGKELDTSRCFMGRERFEAMADELPVSTSIVGIDEQTALLLDFEHQDGCRVFGKGGIHILRKGRNTEIHGGETFELDLLGNFQLPDTPKADFIKIWQSADRARENIEQAPENVLALMRERENARKHKKWEDADKLRARIEREGWEVKDTVQGPQLLRKS